MRADYCRINNCEHLSTSSRYEQYKLLHSVPSVVINLTRYCNEKQINPAFPRLGQTTLYLIPDNSVFSSILQHNYFFIHFSIRSYPRGQIIAVTFSAPLNLARGAVRCEQPATLGVGRKLVTRKYQIFYRCAIRLRLGHLCARGAVDNTARRRRRAAWEDYHRDDVIFLTPPTAQG